MAILYHEKPLTEETKFGERDIYGTGFGHTLSSWFSSRRIRFTGVIVKPGEDLVTKVTNFGSDVPLRTSTINNDTVCRKLGLRYEP